MSARMAAFLNDAAAGAQKRVDDREYDCTACKARMDEWCDGCSDAALTAVLLSTAAAQVGQAGTDAAARRIFLTAVTSIAGIPDADEPAAPPSITPAPGSREATVKALRDMAGYLETGDAIPADVRITATRCISNGSHKQNLAEVDRIAASLGTSAGLRSGGVYGTARKFSDRAAYEAVYVIPVEFLKPVPAQHADVIAAAGGAR